MSKKKKQKMLPAIPPEDYKGSQADWMVALQERGLWDGENPDWHGDVMITEKVWWDILGHCEGDADEDELSELDAIIEDDYKIAMEEFKNEKYETEELKNISLFKMGFAAAMIHFGQSKI